jgi:hypothetical protein
MTRAIDTARELLARTRSISTSLDSIARAHLKVVELKDELSGEPFIGLDRIRQALSTELSAIEALLGKGLVNEAWSAMSAYEGRIVLLAPVLGRLSAVLRKRSNKKMDAAASRELAGIEGMMLALDLAGADRALVALEQEDPSKPACAPPREQGAVTCALCGRTAPGGLGLCPYCGWDPSAPSAECPECGSPVLLSFRSCPSCGKGLPQSDQKRMVLSSLNLE